MSAVRFRFERNFDNGAAEQAAAEELRQRLLIEDASNAAYAQGFAEGEAAAHASLNAKIDAVMQRLAVDAQVLYDHLEGVRRRLIADAAIIAATAGSNIGAAIAHAERDARILAAFDKMLAAHLESPRIVLRVAPAMLEPLRQRFEQSAQAMAFAGKLIFLEDKACAQTDIVIEWSHGGLTLNLDEQRQRLEADALVFAQSVMSGSDLPDNMEQVQ